MHFNFRRIAKEGRILVLDDDKTFCLLMKSIAAKKQIALDYITKAHKLKNKSLDRYNSIWIDYSLDDTTGVAIAEDLLKTHPEIPIVMISTTNRHFGDETNQLPNIKATISKWDLADAEMGDEMIASIKGKFRSYHGNYLNFWGVKEGEQLTQVREHLKDMIPKEKCISTLY